MKKKTSEEKKMLAKLEAKQITFLEYEKWKKKFDKKV